MIEINTVRELSELDAPSSRESAVRDYITKKIDGKADFKIDALGNIIAFKKGRRVPSKKIMFDAHMDEVGLIVSYINDDGTLEFSTLGGISDKVLLGRRFRFPNGTLAVTDVKPIHLLTRDECKKQVPKKELTLDIGASSKQEAEKLVSIGDACVFDEEFSPLGEKIVGKALDDRLGVAILLDMIDSDLPFDAYFTFTVCEETGLTGAKTAAYGVKPDIAVVLESTTAADLPSAEGNKSVCKLSNGAVVSYMDNRTVYDYELFKRVFEIADENNIKAQTKTMIAGGNNAGEIHSSRGGVKTTSISVPTRYIHSMSCVCDMADVTECERLCIAILENLETI